MKSKDWSTKAINWQGIRKEYLKRLDDCYLKGPTPIKMETGLTSSLIYMDGKLAPVQRTRGRWGTYFPTSPLWEPHAACQSPCLVQQCDSHSFPGQCLYKMLRTGLLLLPRVVTTVRVIQTVPEAPLFPHFLSSHFRLPALLWHWLPTQKLLRKLLEPSRFYMKGLHG
jgi:hypothetical protein